MGKKKNVHQNAKEECFCWICAFPRNVQQPYILSKRYPYSYTSSSPARLLFHTQPILMQPILVQILNFFYFFKIYLGRSHPDSFQWKGRQLKLCWRPILVLSHCRVKSPEKWPFPFFAFKWLGVYSGLRSNLWFPLSLMLHSQLQHLEIQLVFALPHFITTVSILQWSLIFKLISVRQRGFSFFCCSCV